MPPHPLWDELRRLELPTRDYVVFGSGPLLAHGLIGDVRDLDLVARGEAWRRAQRLGPVEVAPGGDRRVSLLAGRLEIFGGWRVTAVDTDALIDEAESIGGLPFARLEAVLAFKRALARPKDLAHIRLLERHLLDGSRVDSQAGP